jgi:outer membrane receptor protein involved in Fe transport
MPWTGYPTPICDRYLPATFNVNLGDAQIYGVESKIEYKVTDGLSVEVSAGYDDSHLISDIYP